MIEKLEQLNKARKNKDLSIGELWAADTMFKSALANCADEIIAELKEARIMRRYCLGSDASTENMLKRYDAAKEALEAKIREELK